MNHEYQGELMILKLPDNLSAQRWLLIGAPDDGLDSNLAQRGASLTVIQWDELVSLSGARFDVTVCQQLFQGVRHPLLALEHICALTTSYALLHAPLNLPPDERALLCWTETGWQTNRTALARMARSAGFARVAEVAQAEACATLQAFRQWPAPIEPLAPSLTICRVFNPVTGLSVFPRAGRRAFLALLVAGLPPDARRWDVRVSVGGFGVQPIYVGEAEESCAQINVPLPPGLPLGLAEIEVWHRQAGAVANVIEISEGESL